MTLPRELTLANGSVVALRRAEPDDAAELTAHVNEVAGEEVFLLTERVTRTLEEQREWIRKSDGRTSLLLVAARGARIVATADFRRGAVSKNAHVVEIGLAVRREVRRQGLGRALLAEGMAWAASIGSSKLTLSVFGTHAPAIALYRSLGFVEEGRLRDHVRLRGEPDGLVLMSRPTRR